MMGHEPPTRHEFRMLNADNFVRDRNAKVIIGLFQLSSFIVLSKPVATVGVGCKNFLPR